MRKVKDAYGQELWAYFKGNPVGEIIEREDGYFSSSEIGPKGYFATYNDWPEHQKKAIKFVNGKRILDLGCGVGRHALYLQKKGLDVTGADNSPLVLKICKLRGMKKLKLMAAEEISRLKTNSFDTVIMLGNNFGLFESFKKARKMLRTLYRITSPSGRIIADSIDPHQTDNPVHLEYQKENRKKGRMAGEMLIRIRFEKHIGQWIRYLFVSKKEMNDILKGTGWKVSKFIEGKDARYAAIIEKVKE